MMYVSVFFVYVLYFKWKIC